MIDDPSSDDEHVFAQDFYARKFDGRRTGACTELLRAGRPVVVDDIYRGNPETGVAGVMRRDGFKVYYAENLLWHNLFGLLFWGELFESGQLHSGFDWMPQCLKNRSFATLFASNIAEKLASMRAGTALLLILKSIASYWGRPNGIFSWSYIDVDALRDLLTYGNANAVADIIELMTRDFDSLHEGFPDLMLQKDGVISFIEIKAEGDAIRRNQLTRLRQLQAAGFDAGICRADYRFDCNQDYVVIDSYSFVDGAIDARTYNGFRRYHAACNHCHGPDGMGSTVAPPLIDRLPDLEAFRRSVREGVTSGTSVMQGFAGDPNIAPYVDDIYAYLQARADGALPRGRPVKAAQ